MTKKINDLTLLEGVTICVNSHYESCPFSDHTKEDGACMTDCPMSVAWLRAHGEDEVEVK
jgi:hypothetical protein